MPSILVGNLQPFRARFDAHPINDSSVRVHCADTVGVTPPYDDARRTILDGLLDMISCMLINILRSTQAPHLGPLE